MSQSQTVSDQHSATRPQVEPETFAPELVSRDQWMNWFYGDGGRKIPAAYYSDSENQHSEKIRENWTNFENARWWMENRNLEGITFILTEEDHSLVIDGDDVRDPETGEIHPVFERLIQLANSYSDVSISGTGIHIVLHESLPEGIDKIDMALPAHEDFPKASVEVYDHGQHITMSGDHLITTPNEVRCNPEIVDQVVAQYDQATTPEDDTDEERIPVKSAEYDESGKPDDWPACYYAALKAREKPPTGANKWKIDSLTGQLGIWAGFSVDEITEHFEAYCPEGKWNEEITRKSLNTLKDKIEGYEYPPGIPKLYRFGILSVPTCDCPIHGEAKGTVNPKGPSIHALTPEQRQEVSGSAIRAVSEALDDLGVASVTEISEWTGYTSRHIRRVLNNEDWRSEFDSIEVSGVSYHHKPFSPARVTEERLAELPLSLADLVRVLDSGREIVDTDGKACMLNALHEEGLMTAKEVANQTGYSLQSAHQILNELTEAKLLRRIPGIGASGDRFTASPALAS